MDKPVSFKVQRQAL